MGAWFVFGVMLLIIIGTALKIYIDHFMPHHFSFGPAGQPEPVNPSPRDYGNRRDDAADDDRGFVPSHQEGAGETRWKLAPGSDDGMIVMTQNALQAKLDDAREDGMIRAFAVFQQRGYIPKGKATELKQALFAVSGGRKFQALNAAIDAVEVPVDPSPAPPPPRVTPLGQREIPADLEFAGSTKRN